MSDLIGKTLGRYRIVERLGQGGMAEVYKAYQINLDRYVALKLMHAHLAEDPDFIVRFEREAKNVAALRHPNIVQVHDYDIEGDTPYMVMEFIEGVSLDKYLDNLARRGASLPLQEAVQIVREVGQALAYAHQRNMIHRDVKPANVMMDVSRRVILTDFGLSKILTNPRQTATGLVVGTPAYMAPEQGMGAQGDHRADIYSLGVMLFELTTGRLPYEADTPMAVILKHVNEPLPLPRLLNPNLPDSLEQIILKSLAKKPQDRFNSANEMVACLEGVLSGEAPRPLTWAQSPAVQVGLLPQSPGPAEQVLPGYRVSTTPVTGKATPITGPTVAAEVDHPPEPTLPPQIAEFVGRETELVYFAEKLAATHLAVITGMPGLGKTALAVKLAERVGEPTKTFWHTFHEGEGTNVLIWRLAGFLAWRGQADLWRMLQINRQTGGQPIPSEVLLDYLFQLIRNQGYLLCLDDFNFVDDDPLLGEFARRLKETLSAGQVSVILASRRLPGFVGSDDFVPLAGLSTGDLQLLLTQRDLALSQDQFTSLYAYTGGNAQFVTLAIDALRRTKSSARLISRLAESGNIERFLMKEVDEGLTEEEREVMGAVAVLVGYPGTRDAIAAVLDGKSVRRTLNDLSSRYLLIVAEGENGRDYSQHAMVQAFYYDSIGKRERQAMHLRAGEYYQEEEPDAFRAARHLQYAGEVEQAARLAAANVVPLINRGLARALRQVLEQITGPALSLPTQVSVHEARGDLHYLLGELDDGLREFRAAGELATELLTQGRMLRKQGEILIRKGEYDQALALLTQGRELLAGTDKQGAEEARLAVTYGTVMLALGRYDDARTAAQAALDQLSEPDSNSRVAADLHDLLGKVYFYLGQFSSSLDEFRAALESRQAAADQQGTLKSYSNLAVVYGQQNRYLEATQANEAALVIAERIGDTIALAQIYNNMAVDAMEQGEHQRSVDFSHRSLALCEKMGNVQGVSMAKNNLGEAYGHMGQLDLAVEHLTQAIALDERAGQLPNVVIRRQGLAEVYLTQGRVEEALAQCQSSLALGQEIGDQVWRPAGLRLLGHIHHQLHQWEAARAAFDEAAHIWREHDAPLDLAGVLLDWARLERDAGKADQAHKLALEAAALATQIGADDLRRQAEALNGKPSEGG